MTNRELSGLAGTEQLQPTSHGWQGLLDTIARCGLGRNRYDPKYFQPSPQLLDSATPADLADIDDFYAAPKTTDQ